MNNITTFRPKVRQVKVGAALTWLDESQPIEPQLERIYKWTKYAPRVYIATHLELPKQNGIFRIRLPDKKIKTLLTTYMLNIPGKDVVILAPPTTELSDGYDGLTQMVESDGMGLAWGSHVSDAFLNPVMFVMSSSIIPYLVHAAPEDLTFDKPELFPWAHKTMGRLIMRPRYFDATNFGLMKHDAHPVANAYEVAPPPEPVVEKKKPGRKKKV